MIVKEAAAKLEVSVTTVYALVAAGKLRCFRVGLGRGCIRIAEEHLADYLGQAEPRRNAAPAPAQRPLTQLRNLKLR